ncbi:MAG: peptidoglycan editing factor PgeF [Christensenellaceae bacterium]|jgi:YfiH family protein|nr:peptidoglycan editing factor PgeF [Christensenellaceae bacterium]
MRAGAQAAAGILRGFVYEKKGSTALIQAPSLMAAPGVAHGFSTKEGGISPAPRAGLNLHWSNQGIAEDVLENYRIFAAGAGIRYDDMVIVNHVHGDTVLRVHASHRGRGFALPPLPPCDGIITCDPRVTLVTSHADCGAFFFYDPVHRAVGMAHAGWRGTLMGIGRVMALRMAEEFGTDPADILAAMGPCICGPCFEVDEPLADEFVRVYNCPELKLPGKPGKAHVDLPLCAALQFMQAGILPAHITHMDLCTYENPRLFYSYRRDRGETGSMAAFIRLI